MNTSALTPVYYIDSLAAADNPEWAAPADDFIEMFNATVASLGSIYRVSRLDSDGPLKVTRLRSDGIVLSCEKIGTLTALNDGGTSW